MLNSFSQAYTWRRHVKIYYCDNISFGHWWRSAVVTYHCQSRLPGSLKQMGGSGCLSWQPSDSAWFRLGRIFCPRFVSSVLILMQSSFYNLKTFVLTEALRYHKHISTSLIAVGDIIIGKSFDKLVKARDVKVSRKRWRDRSQTQWYGGSGTGYGVMSLVHLVITM